MTKKRGDWGRASFGQVNVFSSPLGVVFREASAEAFLFGEVVGVMDGRQIRHPFFGVLAVLRMDNLKPESRRKGIEKVYQPIAMILPQPSSAAVVLNGAFDNEKPMRDGEERFELAKKAGTIFGGIRENGIEFFHAPAFDAEDIGRLRDGVVTGRQSLCPRSGDPYESLEFIGLGFVYIHQEMDGGDHDFRMTEPGDVQHRLGPAQLLPRACGRLGTSRRRGAWRWG